MIWINGEPKDFVSVGDRSFQYGDGCFTTILTKHSEIEHWPYHIERMEACLTALGIPFPNWSQVEQWLQFAILPDAKAGVKIHISRGTGGRGYSPAHLTQPNVTISRFEFPAHYAQWQAEGLRLGVCSKRMGLNPLLAGHKHNNRLEQVLLKGEMEQAGYLDGVCLDIHGHIVETTAANIFWLKGTTLYTPSLKNAGVAGVARRNILEYARHLSLKVVKGDFELDHLDNAEEVFISNSLLEVAPVVQISEHKYSIGQQTLRIQEKFNS
ncbi:MAG: aminodeoxychorismate lyase [Vibrio sp.]|uniref:aminodeoxychorismate lyase n=1 Tax=Vibrio sp. TaxID=678 RepID=UPI003A89176A